MESINENITEELLTTKEKYRNRVDLLLNRLSLLSGEDKLLMTMYWENGNSLRQISRLAGSNRKSIARRIHKLTERIMEGQYIACLRNRNRLNKCEMEIAKDYFLLGKSIKNIAVKRHSSYYHVRQTLQKIKRIIDLVRSESCVSRLNDHGNEDLAIKNGGTVNDGI